MRRRVGLVDALFIEFVIRSPYMMTRPSRLRAAGAGLDEGAIRSQEAFLVGVEDRHTMTSGMSRPSRKR